VGALIAFVAAAGPAAAHTELISSTPADQQTISRTPAVVVLTFSEAVLPMGTQVVVTGPQGPVQAGAPKVADSTVSQDLQGGSPAGHYTVAWRVTADDGHPLSGALSFTSEAASDGGSATLGPSDAPSSDEKAASARAPIWVWVLGGVALLAVVGVVARRLTRPTDISRPT
jgi:methionine-rich copper-binding protein CopC